MKIWIFQFWPHFDSILSDFSGNECREHLGKYAFAGKKFRKRWKNSQNCESCYHQIVNQIWEHQIWNTCVFLWVTLVSYSLKKECTNDYITTSKGCPDTNFWPRLQRSDITFHSKTIPMEIRRWYEARVHLASETLCQTFSTLIRNDWKRRRSRHPAKWISRIYFSQRFFFDREFCRFFCTRPPLKLRLPDKRNTWLTLLRVAKICRAREPKNVFSPD